jgi:hypothetical protein
MPSVDSRLLRAQQAALAQDQLVDRVFLNPVKRLVPNLPVAERLIDARATLTMDGASTLELTIYDPEWLVEESGLLELNDDGRIDALDVVLDTLVFRLAEVKREDPDELQLIFEDRAVQLLREHTKPMTASRGSTTRAKFVEKMVGEVRAHPIPFYSPQKGVKQRVAAVDVPSAAPERGDSGFDPGTRLTLKQWDGSQQLLDPDQMRTAATALGVASETDAGDKATLALAEAMIVEAPMFSNPEGGEGTSSGPLQLTDAHLNGSTSKRGGRRDVDLVTRLFLTKGFRGRGGAIDIAREHPDWTAGRVAQEVQGSAFPDRYDAVRDSAKKVIAAFNKGDQSGSASDPVLHVTAYQFTRGQNGKHESSWDAALRLAEEVNWRFFVAGGVAAFVSDDRLILNPAAVVLHGPTDDGLLERPTYDWDHEKPAGETEVKLSANRWAIRPGGVWALLGKFGPVAGRWLVHTAEIDPLAAHKEPAPDVTQGTSGKATPAATSGAAQTLKWARSKIGHFKEEFGNNRGAELDKLEATFNMSGEPWCAIFATTAVAQAVGDRCKTAAVAQIRAWAAEGSHGYQKGFRASPKPGDLLCYGTEHVGLVEKVNGDSLTTIEGNTSANKVARRTVLAAAGDLVRPDYLDQ